LHAARQKPFLPTDERGDQSYNVSAALWFQTTERLLEVVGGRMAEREGLECAERGDFMIAQSKIAFVLKSFAHVV
jgi:hypothetical protein